MVATYAKLGEFDIRPAGYYGEVNHWAWTIHDNNGFEVGLADCVRDDLGITVKLKRIGGSGWFPAFYPKEDIESGKARIDVDNFANKIFGRKKPCLMT